MDLVFDGEAAGEVEWVDDVVVFVAHESDDDAATV